MHDLDGLLPDGSTRRFVSVGAGRLSVLHAGVASAAAPLLFVHGGGSDAAGISWYRALPDLAPQREAFAPDLPGFGASLDADPVGGPDAQADVLAAVMDALGIPRAVVCGVSMGGDAALHLALRHPERVAALVLIAPGGLVGTLGNPLVQAAAWWAAQWPDALLIPLSNLANRFARAALRSIVVDPDALPPEVVAEFTRLARHPRGALGYLRYNQATLGRRGMLNDLRGEVARISVPTLFFHGERDGLVPLAGSREASAAMPDARLVVAPGVGHWAQMEAPDLFAATARAFLADVG